MAGIVLMGFNRIRVLGWTVSDLAFLVSAGLIIAANLSGREALVATKAARRSSPVILVGSIVLLTAGAVSSLRAGNPVESILVVVRFGWITLGLFWVLRSVASDRVAFGRLLGAWRTMLIINAVIAATGQLGLTNFSAPNVEDRQTGFFEQPNELAGLLSIGVPLLLLGVARRHEYKTDALNLLARVGPLALAVFAILNTGSMSNTTSAVAGCLVVLVAGGWPYVRRPRRRSRSPLLAIATVMVAVVGIMSLAGSDLPVVERFTRFTAGDHYVNDSVDTRGDRNALVIQRFDSLLVVGHGFDTYQGSNEEIVEASKTHNMFLLLLFNAGLPGLVGLLAILGYALKQILLLAGNTRGTALHPAALALLGSFVAANVVATVQPTQYQRYYWLPIALIGALWAVRRQELRSAAGATTDTTNPSGRPWLPDGHTHPAPELS